jgi:tetraacyldisaccharide 4'-kinase
MNGHWIHRVWEGKGLLAQALWLLLVPLSFVYFLAVQTRNWLYSRQWLPSKPLEVPVISIGNLTVGGTGKTPACLWLVQELEERGLKVGILSRGYKGTTARPLIVPRAAEGAPAGATVKEAGDEPAMMARIYGKTVCVAKQRYEAGRALLLQQKLDLLLLDDGYQHRKLKRDLDLLVLGADHSGWLLPAGPFREPLSCLARADFYLVTGAEKEWLARLSREGRGTYFVGSLEAKCLIAVESGHIKEYPLSLLDHRKIVTVSGIAGVARFYNMIFDWGGEIVHTLEFPDHHLYDLRDWRRIGRAARNADLIITTEKDILKLAGFPVATDRLFALRVALVVENGGRLVREMLAGLGLSQETKGEKDQVGL